MLKSAILVCATLVAHTDARPTPVRDGFKPNLDKFNQEIAAIEHDEEIEQQQEREQKEEAERKMKELEDVQKK